MTASPVSEPKIKLIVPWEEWDDPRPWAVHVYAPVLRFNPERTPETRLPVWIVHQPVGDYKEFFLVDAIEFHGRVGGDYFHDAKAPRLTIGRGSSVDAVLWVFCPFRVISFDASNWDEWGPPRISILGKSRDEVWEEVRKVYRR